MLQARSKRTQAEWQVRRMVKYPAHEADGIAAVLGQYRQCQEKNENRSDEKERLRSGKWRQRQNNAETAPTG